MKEIIANKAKRVMAAAIALAFVFVFVAAPCQLSASVCKEALEDCLIDAGIASFIALLGGLYSAGAVALTYGWFCWNGYRFCLDYVRKN